MGATEIDADPQWGKSTGIDYKDALFCDDDTASEHLTLKPNFPRNHEKKNKSRLCCI